ncbi:MAG: hypothetical protein GTN76_01760 [Candidatus Aenigmarchaeota archaeon]|nr:hypothetical protein [Candidatus Aenigmarchaeota archaeon]
MKIQGRESECLDISVVRPTHSYKVIVYQKEGDCRIEEKGKEFCRGDCDGFYMTVEFSKTEDGVIVAFPYTMLPPFEYFNENMFVYRVHNLEQLREFSEERGRFIGAKKILNEDTEIYNGAEILGVIKPRCGMEYFNYFLPPTRINFEKNLFLKEALETYKEIWGNLNYLLENMQKNLSDEEMIREASVLTESVIGRGFLLNEFGEDFVSRAVEYRKRKNNKKPG